MIPVSMRLLFCWITLTLCSALASGQAASAQDTSEWVVRIPAQSRGDPAVDLYVQGLLRAALSRTLAPGQSLVLEPASQPHTQNRTISDLMRDRLDVMWTMTTREREQQLQPIRIPLFRGLLGYRVFLIRQGDQQAFDAVQSLEQLALLKAGQDPQWPDKAILEQAGLQVVSGPYVQLFPMLRSARIDYFPRGMNEVLPELASQQGLALESGLLLVYPAPMYFFVRKENDRLRKLLENGLMQMVQDGSYERYFNGYPLIAETLSAMKPEQRRVMSIPNRLLPAETPLSDKRLWLMDVAGEAH